MKEEVLSTSICLVEQAMNSRPLVPASSDPTDLNALSPNNFLNCGEVLQPAVFARDPHHAHHRRVYQQAQHYADAIWTRWLKEYLPTLNLRHKWTETTEPLAKGELVWLVESHSPRGNYPLARVCELHYDSKGVARSAKIITKEAVLMRPVNKLVRLWNVSSATPEDVESDFQIPHE